MLCHLTNNKVFNLITAPAIYFCRVRLHLTVWISDHLPQESSVHKVWKRRKTFSHKAVNCVCKHTHTHTSAPNAKGIRPNITLNTQVNDHYRVRDRLSRACFFGCVHTRHSEGFPLFRGTFIDQISSDRIRISSVYCAWCESSIQSKFLHVVGANSVCYCARSVRIRNMRKLCYIDSNVWENYSCAVFLLS